MEATQAEVEKIIGRGCGYDDTDLDMTPRAGRTIERAISTAREQGFTFVEPKHLLSILDGGEGVTLRILENLGASLRLSRI
ncbi:MAG: hypothetical protein JO235_12620 [Chroococcidiopsidaceae cyanobacterium CP_BM_RX_35]|nr:hypothetical protein [Chroococcidiopsidaceae cyanobacterium CP_BM_RX_35]